MIKFIDLFCGLGGFRIGLSKINAQCVLSCDINEHAREIYYQNFNETPYGDIRKILPHTIPDFDILCAGFPCQPFSRAGRKLGFKDDRGNLFFDLCRIIEIKKPKVLFLENVKNLLTHDNGATFKVIQEHIDLLGYHLSYQVLSSKDFNVPQHRERIILVAIRKDLNKYFDFSQITKTNSLPLKHYLDETHFNENSFLAPKDYTILPIEFQKKQDKSGLIFCGYLNKTLRKKGTRENTQHLSRTHRQCNRIYSSEGYHPTLSAQETAGRYYILIDNKVRKLTINECFRIMGYPENYIKTPPLTQLYYRIGNSVCVTMIEAIAQEIERQVFKP